MRYDLILEGGTAHAWVTELGSAAEDGSFAAFMDRVLANQYTFEDMRVTYVTEGNSFDVKYDEYFKVNGALVDTDYGRYESAYVNGKVERKAEVMTFSFEGNTLELNFKEGTRVQ